jgi:threonyl-tRNA synthetase
MWYNQIILLFLTLDYRFNIYGLFYSQGLADSTVVAKVNGVLWDLDRPFERDAELKLLKFNDEEGQYVFRHSTAHMLGKITGSYGIH